MLRAQGSDTGAGKLANDTRIQKESELVNIPQNDADVSTKPEAANRWCKTEFVAILLACALYCPAIVAWFPLAEPVHKRVCCVHI